ncbi:hypothetical protein ACPW7J_13225 [Ihubacter sp. rT4E-8]|uniref:hypothetical protein n=1 Tax=unclassified Ihubacter TaxID=2633299 RepID=UPI001379A571
MVTIDVKATLICLLLAALVILVVYLIIMAKNLLKTVKETNQILADTAVISGIAAEKAVQIDGMITDVQSAVSDLSEAVRGQQNLVAAAASLVKSLGTLAAVFRKAGEEVPVKKKANVKAKSKNQK